MAKTINELRLLLSAIEPDETMYKPIDPTDVANLKSLIGDEETWIAARAVQALARLNDASAHQAVEAAASDRRPELRIAAARASEHCPVGTADNILGSLLNDVDTGVRKFAVRSSSPRNGVAVKKRLQEIADSDDNLTLRRLAADKRDPSKP